MTKSEYLEALQNKLERFNRELQKEILEDYEQHFAEGVAAGKTEEEIVAELGSIEDMIQELSEEDMKQEVALSEEDTRREDSFTAGYKALVIDGLVADVNLEQSDDGKIYVKYQNDSAEELQVKYRFYQYEKDGVLYIGVEENPKAKTRERMRLFKTMLFDNAVSINIDLDKNHINIRQLSQPDITLGLKIPAGMPKVDLNTISGDVRVRDVTPAQMNLHTISGDVELLQMKVDGLNLLSTSGDIRGSQICGASLDAHTVSGDVEFSDLDARVLQIRTTSGDVSGNCLRGSKMAVTTGSGGLEFCDLEAEVLQIRTNSGDVSGNRLRGGKMTAETGSGDLELEGSFEEYHVGTGSGDVGLGVASGAKVVRVRTGSGDAEVDLTALEDVEVTVRTGSGEGTIYGPGNAMRQVTRGSCTVGGGDCKVSVSTGSGDAKVKCR